MKPNNRALKLIEIGLSAKTVLKLTENQINVLYSKLLSEQPDAQGVTTVSSKNPNAAGIAKKLNSQGVNVSVTETELQEKKKKKNPYAICTSSIAKTAGTTKRSEWSKSDEKRYEACKKEIDESLKESKKSVSLFLEQQIQKIVEKHIPPKITKKELMNYLLEYSAEPAIKEPPVKPKTPTKPTRPANPFQNPRPDVGPSPARAGEPAIKEPPVKPKTPTKPTRPANPFQNPRPDVGPSPARARGISDEKAKEIVINTIIDLL